MANLMPSGAAEPFSGTTGTTLAGTNFTIPTNEGSGGSCTYQSGQGRIRTGSSVGNRTSLKINRATLADGEMVFDWVVPTASTMFAAAICRGGSSLNGDGGYFLAFNNSDITLSKYVPDFNGVSLATQSYSFTPGTLMRTRVAVFGSRTRMRTWVQANPENTATWDMDFTDSGTQPTTGFWGFTNASNTSGSKDFFIDNLNLTDTITPSQATLLATASITPTGALNKSLLRKFIASTTPTGALTVHRVVVKLLTGSTTPAGALNKIVNKGLAGTTTPAGALKRVIQKQFGSSVTPSGALRRTVVKTFAGSAATAGEVVVTALGRIFGRPGIVVVKHRVVSEVRARIRRN